LKVEFSATLFRLEEERYGMKAGNFMVAEKAFIIKSGQA
jgi:hypothetical protein